LVKNEAWINETILLLAICHIITRDLERSGNMDHK